MSHRTLTEHLEAYNVRSTSRACTRRQIEAYFNRTGSTEKLAVRAKPCQSECVGIRLAVEQQ